MHLTMVPLKHSSDICGRQTRTKFMEMLVSSIVRTQLQILLVQPDMEVELIHSVSMELHGFG